MSASKGWSGEMELANAMKELNDIHPPPASKVKQVVNIALKYPNDFKMIVFDIEKWMKKSNIPDRIAGIFLIDSICRGNRALHKDKSKDLFSARFATRLNEIFALLNGSSENDIKSLLRVVDEWIKWDIFPISKLQMALQGIKSLAIRIPTSQSINETINNSSSVSISSELRSLVQVGSSHLQSEDHLSKSSIRSEGLVEISKDTLLEQLVLGKRKNVKYCPYRDSSCPYGDKCRFSHVDGKVYFPTNGKKSRRHSFIPYPSANTLLNDTLVHQLLLSTLTSSTQELSNYYKSKTNQSKSSYSSTSLVSNSIHRVYISGEHSFVEFDGNPVKKSLSSKDGEGLGLAVSHEEEYKKLYESPSS